MAKKCCCCSSFFSCLACFSGNTHPPVDSRESATNLMDASAHAIPNACPDAQFFSPAIATANSTVSPAAATEEADGRRHDPHTVPSASAPPFQAFTSHDASSSADCASTSAVPTQDAPASGGPSSSFPTESDIIKKIREAAEVDEKDGNVNLEGLIQYISELLEFMKKNELDKKRSSDHHLPKSSVFVKSKEVLSETIDAASSLKDVTSFVKVIGQAHWATAGQAHWATAGLLVVSSVLERFEAVSANRDECLGLLDELYRLAKYMKQLEERPRLREGMDDLIQNALEMIVEASLMCCFQISSSKFSRFFKASVDKGKLLKFKANIEKMYKHMKTRFDICLYDVIDCRWSPQATPLERKYLHNAVGIEEPLKEVVKLLESEKNAVAVIVYGFGGMGKSTLADAVFARLDIEGCKYSKVRLFDDITSTPNIVELQNTIIRDLIMGTEPEFRTFEDGQREISLILEKEVAFIYIDNVLDGDRLKELLPMDMRRAKKVRVLITARDKGVCRGCRMKTKIYAMNCLPNDAAMILLKNELNEGLDSSQLSKIIDISGGIPKLLKVFATFIRLEEDKQKAFRVLMENQEHLKSEAFDNIEQYVFAYDCLPERCKDPFLDICLFFKGKNWDYVTDILGESELDMLERRALVSKDRGMTLTVHDVILMIGCLKANGTRFNFTSSSQFEEFLQEDIPGIKGLWYDVFEITTDIPAMKLDSMSNSLRVLRLGSLKVKGECHKRFEKLVFFQGKVAHLPFKIFQMTSNLKHMELNGRGHSGDFEISKRDLQQLRNLQILRLINFAGLKKLPQQLGAIIHGLRELTVIWCSSIEELPRSITKLQYLRVLKMDFCTSLRRLPEDIGLLSSLQELTLSNCEHIEELPESTSKLESLETLDMYACKNLKHLPNDFELLDSLEVLSLGRCESLKVLPPNFEKFSRLHPFATDAIRDMKLENL